MKKTLFLAALMSLSVLANCSKLDFLVSLPDAKYKAATEGKLYMAKFTASWCMPCQWMDQNTSSDDRVNKYLDENYIPVEIDVDDFDGMVIKQKYGVQFLPTIILFNSNGKEVARFEESIGPSRLVTILEEYNIPENSLITQVARTEKGQGSDENKNSDIISRPHLPSVITDNLKEEKVETEVEAEKELTPTEVPAENTKSELSSEEIAFLNGEGIFEIDVKFQAKQGYSIQIGVYKDYKNVLAEINKYKQKFQQRVFVHIDDLSGNSVYRILIGHYDNKEEALTKKIGLESFGIECLVRDLKTI